MALELSQEELEAGAISLVLNSLENLRKAIASGLTHQHFIYSEKDSTRKYYRRIFQIIVMHYQKYGSLLTEEIFQNEIGKKQYSTPMIASFQACWMKIKIANFQDEELDYFIDELTNNAMKDKLLDIPDQLRELTNPDAKPMKIAENIREYIYSSISNLMIDGQKTKVLDIAGSPEKVIELYRREKHEYEKVGGVKVGIPEIDNQINGFRGGQLTVIMGSTGAGKSMTLLNMAVNAHNQGNNVLFFSWEMPLWQCVARYMACKRREEYAKYKNFWLTSEEENEFLKYLEEMDNMSDAYFIFVDQPDFPTVAEIESNCKQLISAGRKPNVIFVDYLGNMGITESAHGMKGHEIVSLVTVQLRQLSRKYEIPIITAQQINREGSKENRKKRESKDANFEKIVAEPDQIADGYRTAMYADYMLGINPQFDDESGLAFMWFSKIKGRDIEFKPFPMAYYPECALMLPIAKENELFNYLWEKDDTDNNSDILLPKDFLEDLDLENEDPYGDD
jgi:replicative DNA helicase